MVETQGDTEWLAQEFDESSVLDPLSPDNFCILS